MAYKTYTINQKDTTGLRCGVDGYQPKYLVENGRKIIKCQAVVYKTLRDDWRVEDIASRICKQLKIPCVYQEPCRINLITNTGRTLQRFGVISDNFELHGFEFISYERLLGNLGLCADDRTFVNLSSIQKLEYMTKVMEKATGLEHGQIVKYLLDMVITDLLVLNQDRHFRNFGVFFNNKTGKFSIAPLFDYGMGLFENDPIFDRMSDLEDCMRHSYIAPFGDDPFELAECIKGTEIGRKYLKVLHIKGVNVNKSLFIHPASYEYFTKIKKALEV